MFTEKVNPELQEHAEDILALGTYLAQVDSLHVVFGVRQSTPTTLDAVVIAIDKGIWVTFNTKNICPQQGYDVNQEWRKLLELLMLHTA